MLYPVIKMNEYVKATWRIVPANTPGITRHCSKCNRKSAYYCSEKFRVNANGARVDIWLIYKCHKCDSTWKLAIHKGISPHELPPGLFDMFIDNDKALAWQYAFDKHFLKQNACTADYANVEYTIEGYTAQASPQAVHIQSPFSFDLKLIALLAKALGVTVGQVKKYVGSGAISAAPEINILRHRIKGDVDTLIIHLARHP